MELNCLSLRRRNIGTNHFIYSEGCWPSTWSSPTPSFILHIVCGYGCIFTSQHIFPPFLSFTGYPRHTRTNRRKSNFLFLYNASFTYRPYLNSVYTLFPLYLCFHLGLLHFHALASTFHPISRGIELSQSIEFVPYSQLTIQNGKTQSGRHCRYWAQRGDSMDKRLARLRDSCRQSIRGDNIRRHNHHFFHLQLCREFWFKMPYPL